MIWVLKCNSSFNTFVRWFRQIFQSNVSSENCNYQIGIRIMFITWKINMNILPASLFVNGTFKHTQLMAWQEVAQCLHDTETKQEGSPPEKTWRYKRQPKSILSIWAFSKIKILLDDVKIIPDLLVQWRNLMQSSKQ